MRFFGVPTYEMHQRHLENNVLLVKKYAITCTAAEFLNLVFNGDEPAKRTLKEMLTKLLNPRSDKAGQ